MMFVEGVLNSKCHYMGGPGLSMALFLYYDDKNPVDLESFDNGEIYERFLELEGGAIDTELKYKAKNLQQYIKHYIEANDLFFILENGSLQPQLEMEIQT